ncbi:MAG TPA: efflux RND transporter periplasmic adaptor subunit [Pseudomonadales bacterium]|nr:efflux RND transporter periplasmic adaptor subunit [Pseudomonadales bacterium]
MKLIVKAAFALGTLIAAGVIIFLLAEFKPEAPKQKIEAQAPLVKTREAEIGSVSIPVDSRGLVLPASTVQLVAEVASRVISISPNFANGGFFRKGDVLLSLDRRPYELQLVRAQAGVAEAERLLRMAQADSAGRGVIQGLETNDLAKGIPQIRSAQANLEAARAQVAAAELQLSSTQVIAPFSGRVFERKVSVGQTVNQGTALANVYAVDVAEVRLPLNDSQLGLVDLPTQYPGERASKGPRALLKTTYAGKEYFWQGEIIRTEGGIDPKNRALYVVARVDEPYMKDPRQPNRPPLTAGMFVEAEIEGRVQDNIVRVPRRAFRSGDRLWLVDESGRLYSKHVEVLHRGADTVYVSGGLNNGERVVVTQMTTAVEGMHVRTISDDESQDKPQDKPTLKDMSIGASTGTATATEQVVATVPVTSVTKPSDSAPAAAADSSADAKPVIAEEATPAPAKAKEKDKQKSAKAGAEATAKAATVETFPVAETAAKPSDAVVSAAAAKTDSRLDDLRALDLNAPVAQSQPQTTPDQAATEAVPEATNSASVQTPATEKPAATEQPAAVAEAAPAKQEPQPAEIKQAGNISASIVTVMKPIFPATLTEAVE